MERDHGAERTTLPRRAVAEAARPSQPFTVADRHPSAARTVARRCLP
jgi:hypothetical protein